MKFSRSTEKGTLFSRFGPIFNADAFAPRVNVEALLAQKADERHIELAGQRDREAAGGRHRTHNGNPGNEALLHDFEAGASAHHKDVIDQGESLVEQSPADDLVHRVVTPHVLAQTEKLASGAEEAGRV